MAQKLPLTGRTSMADDRESDDAGRSLSHDNNQGAATDVESGHGDKGDRKK